MIFWILVAVLVALVTLVITRPLLRVVPQAAEHPDAIAASADIAVYKDQLKEVAADEANGILAGTEAENARSEIARRLLRTSVKDSARPPNPERPYIATYASLFVSIAIPLASLALYLNYGAPGMPGDPLSARIAQSSASEKPNDLIAKVEERLRQHPDDGTGWSVIAPVYYAMGRYEDAANAFANAIRLVGETPDRLQGFANARIRIENGVIPADARNALERLVVLAPDKKEPRIWLALAKEQDGKLAEAADDYRKLISDAPADAPWKSMLEERLAALTPAATANSGSAAPQQSDAKPGAPSGPDAAAVMAMSPDERQAMIAQMVDGLAERLKSNGNDTAGWLRLIRAYQVLGRRDDAVRALGDARVNLKGDQVGLARVDDLARELGLGS